MPRPSYLTDALYLVSMGRRVDPEVSEIFREMGHKGGKARSAKLTPEQRSKIAKKAVQTRVARRREARAKGAG